MKARGVGVSLLAGRSWEEMDIVSCDTCVLSCVLVWRVKGIYFPDFLDMEASYKMRVRQENAQIIFATSEIFPFSKTGGLGDVMGVLPLVLQDQGSQVAVITPFYGRLYTSDFQIRLVMEIGRAHV